MIVKTTAPPPEASPEAPPEPCTLGADSSQAGGFLGASKTRRTSGWLGAKLFLLASCTGDPGVYLPFELVPDAGADAEVWTAPAPGRMPARAMAGLVPMPLGSDGSGGALVGGSGGVAVTLGGSGGMVATGGTGGSAPAPKLRSYTTWPGAMTWPEARAACETQGWRLAVIPDAASFARATDAMGGVTAAWIGLTDAAQEGVWLWLDGAALALPTWHVGQPNDNHAMGEDCAVLQRRVDVWGWSDWACADLANTHIRFGALCETTP